MRLMLPFSSLHLHLTFHVFIYDQNFKINETFASSNGIGLMNNALKKYEETLKFDSYSVNIKEKTIS